MPRTLNSTPLPDDLAELYFTEAEVAERLGIALNTVKRYRIEKNNRHRIPPYVRIGRRSLYSKEAFFEWVESKQQNERR